MHYKSVRDSNVALRRADLVNYALPALLTTLCWPRYAMPCRPCYPRRPRSSQPVLFRPLAPSPLPNPATPRQRHGTG